MAIIESNEAAQAYFTNNAKMAIPKQQEQCDASDAPSRDSALAVLHLEGWVFAFYAPGFVPDAGCLTGKGRTEERAKADYWEQWEELRGRVKVES